MKMSDLRQFIREEISNVETNKLEQLLKKHDWYYSSSDDDRAWQKGDDEEYAIVKQMMKVPEEQAKKLYLKYCPFQNKERNWDSIRKQVYGKKS